MGQQFKQYIVDRGSTTFGCDCLLNQDILISPKNNIHYGKATCNGCGQFLRWIAKPKEEEQ